ncbi:MAG: hypothetical protein OMM_07521, partial [Candidatus Magnetoglobus multicellularis str. Araruama]
KLTYQINEDRVPGIGELIFRAFLSCLKENTEKNMSTTSVRGEHKVSPYTGFINSFQPDEIDILKTLLLKKQFGNT